MSRAARSNLLAEPVSEPSIHRLAKESAVFG